MKFLKDLRVILMCRQVWELLVDHVENQSTLENLRWGGNLTDVMKAL